MRRALGPTLCVALAACGLGNDQGYVEIKTVPVNVSGPVLFLDATRLDPVKGGSAVLKQRVGTMKLQSEAVGGQLAVLCDVVIKKDRITTVTISVLERPPRCQCRNTRAGETTSPRACIS